MGGPGIGHLGLESLGRPDCCFVPDPNGGDREQLGVLELFGLLSIQGVHSMGSHRMKISCFLWYSSKRGGGTRPIQKL